MKNENMIQECGNPSVEDDLHGLAHRSCEGTECDGGMNREGTRKMSKRSSKKLTGSLAAKIVAICLVIVSVVTCVASAATVIAADYLNMYSEDEAVVLDRFNEKLLDRYSVYAIVNYMNENEEELEQLNQTNFRYGIIKTDALSKVDLNDKKSYLIRNIDKPITMNDVNVYSCNWSDYTAYEYNMSLFGYAWINNYAEDSCEEQEVDGYFYDWMNETLYVKVGEHLYPYSGEVLAAHLYAPADQTQNEEIQEDTEEDSEENSGEMPADTASAAEYVSADGAKEENAADAVESVEYEENNDADETSYQTEDAAYTEEYE